MLTKLFTDKQIYTVTRLNQEARQLLESNFATLWIEGEISNLSRPSSGHIYFTLKDELAQVRCAMFRLRKQQLAFTPENGMHVLAWAQISLYEARGDFQIIIEDLELHGDGLLLRAFEKLKQQLAAEGLFDSAHKKILPQLPQCIGIITSPTGAAIRDVLVVLKRRFPAIPVIIYPTQVQGEQAANQIVYAIRQANQHQKCDALIICRGGGSLEDLWSFNEEKVARAIYQSEIPTVTGIGHEIDFTIADLVADRRAATPSAAAELISPDKNEWLQQCEQLLKGLVLLTSANLHHHHVLLLNLEKRLQHPGQRIQQQAQYLDHLEQTLHRLIIASLRNYIEQLNQIILKLYRFNPAHHLNEFKTTTLSLHQRLTSTMQTQIKQLKHHLANISRALNAVSPLNTLDRGYAILTHEKKIITSVKAINLGEKIRSEVSDGYLYCTVNEIKIKK
jgi:exodeoxyribonuclease VII large subunit